MKVILRGGKLAMLPGVETRGGKGGKAPPAPSSSGRVPSLSRTPFAERASPALNAARVLVAAVRHHSLRGPMTAPSLASVTVLVDVL